MTLNSRDRVTAPPVSDSVKPSAASGEISRTRSPTSKLQVFCKGLAHDDSGKRLDRLLGLTVGEAGFPGGIVGKCEVVVIEPAEHRFDLTRRGHGADAWASRTPFGLSLPFTTLLFLFPEGLTANRLLLGKGIVRFFVNVNGARG